MGVGPAETIGNNLEIYMRYVDVVHITKRQIYIMQYYFIVIKYQLPITD